MPNACCAPGYRSPWSPVRPAYDQAHLTRHFKRIVGLTPGRYLRDATT